MSGADLIAAHGLDRIGLKGRLSADQPLSSVTWTPVTLPPLKLIFLKPLPSGASLVISPCGTLLVESVVVASGSAGDQTPV